MKRNPSALILTLWAASAALSCGKVESGRDGNSPTGSGGATGGAPANGDGSGGSRESDCPLWEDWDPAVRAGVELSLSGQDPDPEAWANVSRVTIIGAHSLDGLGCLTGLASLVIQGSSVSDVAIITSLPHLEVLVLESDVLTTVVDVAQVESLLGLTLRNTPITDLHLLGQLTNVDQLYFENVPGFEISSLSGLHELYILSITDVPVTQLSALAEHPRLGLITLDGTDIADISPLIRLDALEFLTVRRSPLRPATFTEDIPTLLEQGVCVEWTDAGGDLQQEPESCFPTK